MKTVIIHGQSHQGSTYHIAHALGEKIGGECREFFLPRDFDSFCVGCNQCFMESEKKCPHYGAISPITSAMDEADVIILLQQDKAHTTITVTFISKRSIHNLLQVLLLERTVQPKAVGHLHRIFRCLHLRRQSLTEAELRVRPSLPSDACGMPGIGTCLEQSAGVALFINRFLIE